MVGWNRDALSAAWRVSQMAAIFCASATALRAASARFASAAARAGCPLLRSAVRAHAYLLQLILLNNVRQLRATHKKTCNGR